MNSKMLKLCEQWEAMNCRTEAQDRVYRECARQLRALLSAQEDGKDAEDAARYRFLRDDKSNSLSLGRNEGHAPNYMTAAEWIDASPDLFEDESPEEIQRMKDSDTIWSLQAYPHTPIGFYRWSAASLDVVVDAARELAKQEAK